MRAIFNHRLVCKLGVRALEAWVAGGSDPVNDNLMKFNCGHSWMGCHEQRDQSAFACRRQSLHVTFKCRLEGLSVVPFRIYRSQCLQAIERKGQLGVHWLFNPQCPVVVDRGDAICSRHEIGRTFSRYVGNEIQYRLLRSSVIPGGQWTRRRARQPG